MQQVKNTAEQKPEEKAEAIPEVAKVETAKPEDTASARLEVRKKKATAKKEKGPTFGDSLKKKSVEELTEIFNDMVPTAIDLKLRHYDVKKMPEQVFMTIDMGVKACERLHNAIQKTREAVEKKETKTVKRATKKTASKSKSAAPRAKKSRFEETMKVTWKGKDNPFREGSGRWKRTEIVRACNGKTVKTFLEKRGRLTTLAYCVKSGLASVA